MLQRTPDLTNRVCSFTISLWMTKQNCDSSTAEVLYSHSQARANLHPLRLQLASLPTAYSYAPPMQTANTPIIDRSNSNINIQLLCESYDAIRVPEEQSTVDGAPPSIYMFRNSRAEWGGGYGGIVSD